MIKVYTQSNIATKPTIAGQQGSTLVIVLMIVLLIAIIGAMAVRNSQVSLDMTTSSQINQLLAQSSDAPLAKLDESSTNEISGTSQTVLQRMADDTMGPIGFLRIAGQENNEYVICYQPTERNTLYNISNPKHRILIDKNGTRTKGDRNAYCRLTSGNVFTSERQTVASQVSITRPTINASTTDDVEVPPLSGLNTGTDLTSKSQASYFRVYVTSVLPVMSISSTNSELDTCLQKPIGGLAGKTKADNQIICLNSTDTPINVQVQDYMYGENSH